MHILPVKKSELFCFKSIPSNQDHIVNYTDIVKDKEKQALSQGQEQEEPLVRYWDEYEFIFVQDQQKFYSTTLKRFFDYDSLTVNNVKMQKEAGDCIVVDRIVFWPHKDNGFYKVQYKGFTSVVFNHYTPLQEKETSPLSEETKLFISLFNKRLDHAYSGHNKSKDLWKWLATIVQKPELRVKGLCLEFIDHKFQYLVATLLKILFGESRTRIVPNYELSPHNNRWIEGNRVIILDDLEVNDNNRNYLRSLIARRVININTPTNNYPSLNHANIFAFAKSNKEFVLDSRYWLVFKDRGFVLFDSDYQVAEDEMEWLLDFLENRDEFFYKQLRAYILSYDLSKENSDPINDVLLSPYVQF